MELKSSSGGASLPARVLRPQLPALATDEARELAREVYCFAYPLLLMDLTLRQMTSVTAAPVPGRAPINRFAHFRSYPDASARDVVRLNFDTLYSTAWVDLRGGPVVLSVPDTGGRYHLIPALDMWTDVFCSLGSRTTGTGAGKFAFVPPGWRGEIPAGVERVDAPTPVIWILGRIQANGPSDYEAVRALQDGLLLTGLEGAPLVERSTSSLDIDLKTPPPLQLARRSAVELFTRFGELMRVFPAHMNDAPILLRMRALGLSPGRSWDPLAFEPVTLAAIEQGVTQAREQIVAAMPRLGKRVNGWTMLLDGTGTYGTSYAHRAAIALGGLGANLPEDAIYPTAFVDGEGRPLDGARKYLLHFEKGQTPPAGAFWSITMYDGDGFQVPNRLGRFAIGDRDPLQLNADGSLDLWIQSDSPGAARESNWLPSPSGGPIAPTMRIYAPRAQVRDGRWRPPALLPIE